MTRQQIATAMQDEPDALAVLRRFYPEAAAVNGPEWVGALCKVGWKRISNPVRAAFWTGDGLCGFVGKPNTNGRDFIDHNGARRPVAGLTIVSLPG